MRSPGPIHRSSSFTGSCSRRRAYAAYGSGTGLMKCPPKVSTRSAIAAAICRAAADRVNARAPPPRRRYAPPPPPPTPRGAPRRAPHMRPQINHGLHCTRCRAHHLYGRRRMAIIQFPDPRTASPEGIVAIGGRLHPDSVLAAYRQGIFPWPVEKLPLLWFCPAERGVLDFTALHVPRSLRRSRRQTALRFSLDRAFREVIRGCAETR